MFGEEMVIIPLKEYNYLLKRNKKLSHLEANGVNNWEGYFFNEDEDEDE